MRKKPTEKGLAVGTVRPCKPDAPGWSIKTAKDEFSAHGNGSVNNFPNLLDNEIFRGEGTASYG